MDHKKLIIIMFIKKVYEVPSRMTQKEVTGDFHRETTDKEITIKTPSLISK